MDDGEWCLELGPHDDRRVKFAAKQTFDKWAEELNKEREQPSQKPGVDSRSSVRDEKLSDLEEGIFSLMTYYDFEIENGSATTSQSTVKENAIRQEVDLKIGRNTEEKRLDESLAACTVES